MHLFIKACVLHAFLYINKRILNVGFYLSVSETTDISLHEKKVKDWIQAFYKAKN